MAPKQSVTTAPAGRLSGVGGRPIGAVVTGVRPVLIPATRSPSARHKGAAKAQ